MARRPDEDDGAPTLTGWILTGVVIALSVAHAALSAMGVL